MLTIVVQVEPPFVEYSHLTTLPVWPDKVNVPLLVPEHIAVLVPTVPPTDTALMVSVAAAELADAHTPL